MVAILVVLTIIFFLFIDYIIHRKQGNAILQSVNEITERKQTKIIKPEIMRENDLRFPGGFFLHPRHTWAFLFQSGKVKVGMDDFVSKIIGTVDKILLPAIGTQVHQGERLFSVNFGNKKLDFISPVSGSISQVNGDLMKEPSSIKDAYNHGWCVVIDPSDIVGDMKQLKLSDDALLWIKNELRRFRDFLLSIANNGSSLAQTYADGGLPMANVLLTLREEQLAKFQKEFLLNN
jgi:glycine cleavage system H lipoate-binding protein